MAYALNGETRYIPMQDYVLTIIESEAKGTEASSQKTQDTSKYNNLLLDGIRKEESEKGQERYIAKESVETGWAGAILGGLANAIPVIGPIISSSSYFINEALESGIDSAGPYQISKNIAHSAVMAHMSVDEKITKWKTTKPTEDQTTDYIRTEEGGRIVAKWVKEDNDKSLERMYKLAGQEIPSIGTSERILIDATSWNGGSGKTVSAGIQYAMQEIGVDVQTVDGYLYEKTGTGNEVKYKSDTAELFIRWLHKPEQQQKYAGYIDDEDIRKAFYKGPVAVLNSPVFNIIDEESRQKNGVPAQITIPAEETERSDIKGLNYGKRVLDSVSEKAKEGNTPLVSYTSQDSNKITVTLAKEIPNSGGEWKAVKEEVEVDPELARAYRDSQRYLQYIYPNIDKYEVLTSVVRSEKEQKAIQETKGELAAAPGTSSHEGKAIDINVNHIAGLTKLSTNEVVVSLDQIYGKHRIARTNKDESWHYELLPETPSELDDQLKKQFPSMSDEERDENVRLAFGNVNEYYKLTPKTWGGVAEGHEITVGDESFLVTQVSYPSSGRVKIITQGVDGSPGQTIYMPTLEEIDDTISIKPSGDLKTSNIIGRPAVAPQVTVSPPAASPSTIAASTPNLGEQKTLPNQLFVTSKKTETKEGARVTEEQYIAEPTDTSWFSRTFGETEYISPDGTLNRKGGLFGSDRIGYVSEETSTGNYLVLSSNFNGFYDNYPRFSLLPTYGSGELRLFPDLKGEYDINTKHPTEETTVREVRDKTGKVVGTLEQKKEGEPPVFKPNTGIDPSTIVKGSSVKSTAPNTGQKFTWGLKGYLWNDEREVRYTTEGYFEVLDDNKNWVRPENLPSTSVRSDQEKAFIDKLAVVNQEEDRTRRDQVADWALKTTINYDGIFGIPIDVQNDVYLSKTDSKDGSTELWGDTAFQGNRRITSEDINSILGIGTSAVPPASAPATKSAASSPTDLSTKHPTELYDLASQGNTDAKKELETRSNLGDQEAAYYLDSLSTTSSTPIVNPPATANPTPATKSAATSPTLETPSPIPKMYEYTYVYDSDIGGKSEAIYALGEDFEWYVSSGEGASVEKVTDKNTVNALDDYFFSWLDYTPESDAQPSPAPNQQPTAPIVSGTLNPENPEEATHQQIIDAKAKNKKTLTYFMTDDQKYKLAYNLVWEFMDLALENWVYPMVDDMCKEDWDSSEATNSGSDTSSGGGGTGGTGAEATCTNHSYTGNLELNGTTHKIYYSISACSSSLTHYKVYLKSDGVSDYTIDEGYTVQGIVVRESLTKELPYQYTLLCIEVGESERCF
jgi:hypothetical protein